MKNRYHIRTNVTPKPLSLALCCATAVGLFLGSSKCASAQETIVLPPDTQLQPAEPWMKIGVPPLHAFHPELPKRIQLKNGLVVLLEPDHELPFIDGSVMIRGGSRDVPVEKTGLIDLYGETWRTSGTASMTGDRMDDLLEAKAAKVETAGTDDLTVVFWSCLTKDEDQVFGMVMDLLKHPAFSEAKLKLARQQETTSISRRNDVAAGIAQREARKLVYGVNSPYTRQPEFATVDAITVDDLKAWHDKTVVPNNIVVAISGDFDPDALEKTLRAAFEDMPKGTPLPVPAKQFAGPTPGVYSVNREDVNQSNIWIVGLGTERSNPDYYALTVMNEIFGGGFGSRLFQDVRTRQGLAYSVSGGYGSSYDHPGMFYATTSTKSASTTQATQAVLDEIAMLNSKPFAETELTKAKNELLSSFVFRIDSRFKILAEARTLEFYGYPPDFLEKYRKGIEAVTIADLERVARKYIDPSKLAVLVVGNEAQYGTPLVNLKLGPARPIDVTIPAASTTARP